MLRTSDTERTATWWCRVRR